MTPITGYLVNTVIFLTSKCQFIKKIEGSKELQKRYVIRRREISWFEMLYSIPLKCIMHGMCIKQCISYICLHLNNIIMSDIVILR